jgi:hypothetical protein
MVSGVCVLDYCRTAFGSNPITFAECYYVRFPKVALGHWPPMFYIIQAAWYAIFGVTTYSAILLMGVITATASIVLVFRLMRVYGLVTALLSAGVFLSLPLVRLSALLVMADMLASLLTLLAILALLEAETFGRRGSWMAFALWTIAAVLTKESVLVLLVVAPAAILLPRGKALLVLSKAKQLVICCSLATFVLLLYGITGVLHLRGVPMPAGFGEMRQHLSILRSFFSSASVMVFLVVGYGIIRSVAGKTQSICSERRMHTTVATIWLTAVILSQLMFRSEGLEPRYFLPAFFPLTMLFAEGLAIGHMDIMRRLDNGIAALAIAAALGGVAIASTPEIKLRQRTGYTEIAASIPHNSEGAVVLVSADAPGEGALIVQRLVGDDARAGVVLRASKVLSSSKWMGEDYALKVKSVDEVRRLLDSIPVHFIVIDANGFIQETTRMHHRLLEEAVTREPRHFRLFGDFPLYTNGHRRNHAVQVYENLNGRGRRAGIIRLDMTNTLGRFLTVRLEQRNLLTIHRPRLSGSLFWRFGAQESGSTRFSITPDSDRVGPGGGRGQIWVTALAAYAWSIAGVPSWITIADGAGSGDGMIRYEVAENRTNESRSATMSVGDAKLELSQPRSAYTYVPFVEEFRQLPLPVWQMRPPDSISTLDPPCRWFLDDQSGQNVRVKLGGHGPEGSSSLIIEKPRADQDAWKTQVWLPRLELQPGAKYRASVWLKAEHASFVRLELGQRTAPYHVCGFSTPLAVDTEWTKFTLSFRATGHDCGAENNRFSIQAGAISGKLSIARLSLVEESPERRPRE